MKKLFISLCLLLAIASVYAQNFVPDPTQQYYIQGLNSGLYIGVVTEGTTQPALTNLQNLASQAFNFIPTGAPDTYNLLTVDNMYLNKKSTDWDANWMTIFEPTANGTSSEWVLTGTDSTSVIFMCNANSKYMGFDGSSVGSSLYCDKGLNNWSGTFALKVAHVDVSPKFKVLSNNLVFEIEKTRQSYPMIISASNQSNTINATVSNGFSISQSTFTPKDFADGGGKIQIDLSAPTANIGDTGKVVFSYTSGGVIHKLDSAIVTPVAEYERLLIRNNGGNQVIGSSSSNALKPVLVDLDPNIDNDGPMQFFFRPVHRNVTDSLFYIVQDGDYKALMKDLGSHYEVDLGTLGDSLSVWKIIPHPNGIKQLYNVVNKLSLGCDGVYNTAGIWCDKAFNLNPTSGPWSEWTFVSAATALDISSSVLSSVTLSTGFLDKPFVGATTSYNVLVPADIDTVKVSGNTQSILSTIAINPDTLVGGKPSVLSVVSQDSTSTTTYNFNLVKMTFDKWAAGGENALPTKYGWKCPNAKWALANTADSTYSRYFDNPLGYKYNSSDWTGRALLLNWDGNVTDTVAYSYPVILDGGKSYTFTGKYAWSSVTIVDLTTIPESTPNAKFTFGINTAANNSGSSVASLDLEVVSGDTLNFHDAKLTFTPATSGVYYLTIKNNLAIKAAVADLSISEVTGLNNALSSSVYATVSKQTINVHGTLAGDAVKVYNISGQLVKQLTANSDITSINLNSGVYLIKVNANILKVVK
jgi:hypothetical protein